MVGEPLPPGVVAYEVPNHDQHGYTVVNDWRVLVDPHTRRVIQVIP